MHTDASTLLLTLFFCISKSSAVFKCSDGPPGLYCTRDLSGYHDCTIVNGTYVNKVVTCPAKTRCQCFYGPACSPSLTHPCASYMLPPSLPHSFTLKYKGIETSLSPVGRFKDTTEGLWYQYISHKNPDDKRGSYVDRTGDIRKHTVVIPSTKGRWKKYMAYTTSGKCYQKTVSSFPVYHIPTYFSYNGLHRIGGRLTQRWKFVTGGRHIGQAQKIEYYYVHKNTVEGYTVPLKYYAIETGMRTTKYTSRVTTMFYPTLVPYSMQFFLKPRQCR